MKASDACEIDLESAASKAIPPEENYESRKWRLLPVPAGIKGFFKTTFRLCPILHNALFFAFFGLLQGDPADKSVCGYNLTNPLWVNVFFGMLVFSGAELSVRLPITLVNKVEPRQFSCLKNFNYAPYLQPVMKLLAACIGVSMVGFVALPRCIFNGHQVFVLLFMYGGGLLLLMICLFYPDLSKVYVVTYFGSCYVCYLWYWEGGYEFMAGEAGFIFSYVNFMTATLQPRLDRKFNPLHWLLVTLPMGYLLVYVENEVIGMCLNTHLIDMN